MMQIISAIQAYCIVPQLICLVPITACRLFCTSKCIATLYIICTDLMFQKRRNFLILCHLWEQIIYYNQYYIPHIGYNLKIHYNI